jgi:hypothetical protein
MQRRRRTKGSVGDPVGGVRPAPAPKRNQETERNPGHNGRKKEDPIPAYRNALTQAFYTVQDSYDKTLIALSSASVALSITFMKDILACGTQLATWLLKIAWICWAMCFVFVLVSYWTSYFDLKKTLERVNTIEANDEAVATNQQLGTSAGGWTQGLTVAGGILYFAGLVLFLVFGFLNWK